MVGLEHPMEGHDRGRDRLRAALVARAAQQSHLKACRAEKLARLRTCAVADGHLALLTPAPAEEPAPGARTGASAPTVAPAGAPIPTVEPAGKRTLTAASAPRIEPNAAPNEAAAPVPAADNDLAPAALPPGALRDAEALERLLAALIGSLEPAPDPVLPAPPAAVVPLPRPAREQAGCGDAGGLATLPGAGPGLVAALIRAGVPDLATLAALGSAALAARLGPIARLIDLEAWLTHARGSGAI
jgi:hypothetical protein